MKSLDAVISEIDSYRDEMIETVIDVNSIPALAPVNGGDGEGRKADYLMTRTKGFDSVQRIDVPDINNPSVMRSNILAKKNGKGKGTLWMVAHIDVVPTGDPALWDNPPFEPVYKDGRVYGRGTEDNGQSVVSSIFASRQFLDEELNGMSLGIAWVADEETSSVCGIQYLLDHGYFSEDDIIMVPDWGSDKGSMVDVAEKHIMWLKFTIEGKTTHASTPDEGINAYKVSTLLLMDLMDTFQQRFGDTDETFLPNVSTFEPTMRPATVENVNTIPGHDEFCVDVRLNPNYDPDDVFEMAEELSRTHAEATGAKISVEKIQFSRAGVPSSMDSLGFRALSDAVESVTGVAPKGVGIGGGTCANFFRRKGLNAYAWQHGGGTLHAPNEYVEIDNLMIDTKVFATLFYKLCVG